MAEESTGLDSAPSVHAVATVAAKPANREATRPGGSLRHPGTGALQK